MSIKHTSMVSLLLPLLFAVACTDKDRAQAAKKSDAVESFRYVPGDAEKYIKKDEARQPVKDPKIDTATSHASNSNESTNINPKSSTEK